jgi:hypothetical protein
LIHWQVQIADPAAGTVSVRGQVAAEVLQGCSAMELEFVDLRRHPGGLRVFAAGDARGTLPTGPISEEPHRYRVDLAGRELPVIIEYVIDPTFYPPGSPAARPSYARSRVTAALAVIRTTSLLPKIGCVSDGGRAGDSLHAASESNRVSFELPDGWSAVTPWTRSEAGYTVTAVELGRVDYLGLGPFEVADLVVDGTPIRIAGLPGEADLRPERAVAVVRAAVDRFGMPRPGGTRVATVVPREFMSGGAAGSRSIVQGSSPITFAHEVFHWWTHAGLVAQEAVWLSEGFTTWYGVELALETNLLEPPGAEACLGDLDLEMRLLEADDAMSLADASRQYRSDSRARRIVYSKGALLASLLAGWLRAEERDLDALMQDLFSAEQGPVDNAEILSRIRELYGDTIGDRMDRFVLEAVALPPTNVGLATGTSGCAR